MSTIKIGAIALAAVLALGSTGAEARDYHRHRRGGNGNVVGAIIGGLALGALGGAIIAPRYGYGYAPPPPVGYYQPPVAYAPYGGPSSYYATPPGTYYAPAPPPVVYAPPQAFYTPPPSVYVAPGYGYGRW